MAANKKYIFKRLFQMLIIMWVIVTILFFMFRLMPGNPLAAYISPTFTGEQEQALRARFGLDESLGKQYLLYMSNLFQGRLGDSFFYNEPVTQVLLSVLPNTLYLMFLSLALAYLVGILGGILLAWKRGEKLESVGLVVTLFTRAAPQFWVGMILLSVFAFGLRWFPSGGVSRAGMVYASELQKLLSPQFWQHLFLPSLTMAVYLLGLPLLLMRSNMLEVMGKTYVEMARMKGLKESRIMFKYVARNAALPVVTALAIGIGYAMGGNVVIETVFSWPGLGRVLVRAVSSSDYPLAQGAFLIIAMIMVFMNFTADLLYSFLDPRIKIKGEE